MESRRRYKIILKVPFEDDDEGESYHYENRCIIKVFTDKELEKYLKDHWVVDFEKINHTCDDSFV
jgi:hypothetical protein